MKFLCVAVCFSSILFFDCHKDQTLPSRNPVTTVAASANKANANQNSMKNNRSNDNFQSQIQSSTPAMNQNKTGDLEYTVQIKKDGQNVLIDYQIKNNGKKSYVLFNRGISPDCENGKAFVEAAENGVVEIAQKLFRAPENIDCPTLEAPIEQGVSTLKPGQTINEKIRLALPLKYDTPFNYCYRGAAVPTLPQPPNKVKFCLGYLETDLDKSKIENCRLKTWQGTGEQKLLCSEIVEF